MAPSVRTFAALVLAFSVTPIAVAAADCGKGLVYLDRDRDGVRDPGESGVPGVRLSDGRTIAETDSRGRFDLPVAPGRPVFLIKPAGYAAPTRADGLPDTWRDPSEGACRDFALIP